MLRIIKLCALNSGHICFMLFKNDSCHVPNIIEHLLDFEIRLQGQTMNCVHTSDRDTPLQSERSSRLGSCCFISYLIALLP